MTDTFITQCPHCQTSFRLQHSQLSAARGSVRCGACLQVFNAARQINPAQSQIPSSPQLTPTPTTPAAALISDNLEIDKQQAAAVTSASKKTLMIHDDMDLDDLDDLDLDEDRILYAFEKAKQEKTYDHTEVWKMLGV